MTQLLLSFCYAKPSGHVLARFDAHSDTFEWVDLGDVAAQVVGATGLCRVDESYYAALQIRVPGTVGTLLAEIDASARIRRVARLAAVLDAHSLLAWGDELLVVSSGTNQVLAIDWPRDGALRTRVFFEIDPGADTLHMNSLQAFGGHVYLSMFGCKPGASWRDACDGHILDLTDDARIVRRGLRHPHSLFVDRGTLLCVTSRDGSLVHVAGQPRGADRPLDGYVRGAVAHGGRLFVGTSMARTQSKSRGMALPAAGAPWKGAAGTGCGLHVIEGGRQASRWIDLSAFGAELYDIVPWDGEPVSGAREEAMVSRLRAVNAEFGELIGTLYRMRTHHGAVARMLRAMLDAGTDLGFARETLAELANDPPALPEWSYLHARLLLAGGSDANRRAALPFLMSALEGGYDTFDVLSRLARIYDALGDHINAATHAHRALAAAPAQLGTHERDTLRALSAWLDR
ncbi:DUF4915 domain-containing protein [Trinickia caryophylli]|uniref:Conserved hypothetical protein CHP03032 domain-containing protein n=1 Tax=Trinickia caryophylli TaxID=28094 RepID=A0A1X7EE24_TRICW|nr:DUF4915 domain-containing protein [Trinickia caryophylli]PMS12862.1 DUF4915 domain-containing protein [Trinickia caryophylli]TRX14613.1 DUF4915 domain-containing protein [Trinickia caryophylli]WQE14455.1 DUF4915 domain-containing protein [Trinickia caryophylli]SMF32298.1 protein of unknown function [Trinickia caryophylli]GLU32142.1 hypothetical protein Busp01_19840 [Trinickia caryophylli]